MKRGGMMKDSKLINIVRKLSKLWVDERNKCDSKYEKEKKTMCKIMSCSFAGGLYACAPFT